MTAAPIEHVCEWIQGCSATCDACRLAADAERRATRRNAEHVYYGVTISARDYRGYRVALVNLPSYGGFLHADTLAGMRELIRHHRRASGLPVKGSFSGGDA